MKRLSALVFFILLFNLHPANAVDVLPEPFFKYLGSKYLANPGVILIDGSSNEIVYESGSDKPRTPASVLKVISASAMALTLDSTTVFKTALYKTEKKGVFVTVFFGAILLSSTIAIAIPGMEPEDEVSDVTLTGTPADNFPDDQRTTFCSSGGDAKSTDYVTEYLIPTECTGPLAIVSDYDGNVWFTEVNTGSLGKFNPNTETFTEYPNTNWIMGDRSMMRGIDYAPDGSIWFTDDFHKWVWTFSTIAIRADSLSSTSITIASIECSLIDCIALHLLSPAIISYPSFDLRTRIGAN